MTQLEGQVKTLNEATKVAQDNFGSLTDEYAIKLQEHQE